MDENKKVTPDTVASENVSPKKQKKLEKIEAKLAKKREKARKTVILDSFGKHIMKTFIVIAFVAVLIPFGAVTLSQKHGEEEVAVASAVEYATNAFQKETPKSISYSYKAALTDNSEEFIFSGETLKERTSIVGNTKTIMRLPTNADIDYVKQKYSSYTDEQAKTWIKDNNRDYLFINYTKGADGKWTYTDFSITSSNYTTFAAKGENYLSIISYISGITTITDANVTKATAETKYNLFGFGYGYENYTVYFGNDTIVFDGNAVTEVYDFSTLTRYSVTVKL